VRPWRTASSKTLGIVERRTTRLWVTPWTLTGTPVCSVSYSGRDIVGSSATTV